MACDYCRKRGKLWHGAEPVCGFHNGVYVAGLNWNCATLNLLRRIPVPAVAYDDEAGKMLAMDGGFVVLRWYKRRGRVDDALFVGTDGVVVPLRLADAEELIAEWRASGREADWFDAEFDEKTWHVPLMPASLGGENSLEGWGREG